MIRRQCTGAPGGEQDKRQDRMSRTAIRRWLLAISAVLAAGGSALAQEKVRFPSLDSDLTKGEPTLLEGLLYRPAVPGPAPAIVLMHGCGGLYGRDGVPTARHHEWAWRLHGLGYVVLHVDSFTPRNLREICSSRQRTISPSRERPRDAYGALAYLQTLPFVQPDRIGLLGWSNGGSTTLYTVDAALAARPKGLRHDFAAAVAFYPGCRAPLTRKTGWSTAIPLLILIGEADDWTQAQPCVELAGHAKGMGASIDIRVYPGAYHDFDAPNMPLRVRHNVATTSSGTATLGTDPAARADALERAPAFLARYLRP
jgi:dienelactone hydrolase